MGPQRCWRIVVKKKKKESALKCSSASLEGLFAYRALGDTLHFALQPEGFVVLSFEFVQSKSCKGGSVLASRAPHKARKVEKDISFDVSLLPEPRIKKAFSKALQRRLSSPISLILVRRP